MSDIESDKGLANRITAAIDRQLAEAYRRSRYSLARQLIKDDEIAQQRINALRKSIRQSRWAMMVDELNNGLLGVKYEYKVYGTATSWEVDQAPTKTIIATTISELFK